MNEPEAPTTADDQVDPDLGYELPPGQHPLEIAARSGIGPLSPLGRNIWHGNAVPCVSCGQLVRRDSGRCEHCGQDLSDEMIEKMRAHAGPWYVLEHLRPFPGVTLERIIRQMRRGLLTETSIVRGPSTDYQWRFAVAAPGLCRYFGKCWNCHADVTPADTYCQACLSHLSFEKPRFPAATQPQAPAAVESAAGAEPGGPASRPSNHAAVPVPEPQAERNPDLSGSGATERAEADSPVPHIAPKSDRVRPDELARLADAVHGADVPQHASTWDAPPRVGPFRATWVVTALLVIVIAALLWITDIRKPRPSPAPTTPDATSPFETGRG